MMVDMLRKGSFRLLCGVLMVLLFGVGLIGCNSGSTKTDEETSKSAIGKIPEGGVPGPPGGTGVPPPVGAKKK